MFNLQLMLFLRFSFLCYTILSSIQYARARVCVCVCVCVSTGHVHFLKQSPYGDYIT